MIIELKVIELAAIILGSGAVTALVTYWVNRKKHKTERESLIVNQALALAERLDSEVASLRNRMDTYAQRETELLKRINHLEEENRELKVRINELKLD